MKIILGILEHDRCKERVREPIEHSNFPRAKGKVDNSGNIQVFLLYGDFIVTAKIPS